MALQAITKAHIEQEIAQCNHGIGVLESQKEALLRKKKILGDLLEVQAEIEDGQTRFPKMAALETLRIGTKSEGKTDTEVLEEILSEHGPLNISDLIEIGRQRGVPFIGKTSPKQMARSKLSSSQRFVLLRTNVWGLPSHLSNSSVSHSTNGSAHKQSTFAR